MSLTRWATWLHKWIALVVGVQILLWVAGGLVMSWLPIEHVRGAHHAPTAKARPVSFAGIKGAEEIARTGGLRPTEARLRSTPRGPAWTFKLADESSVDFDAASGVRLREIGQAEAVAAARLGYQGDGRPVSARRLARAPQETGKSGPLWRVDFDDKEKTSLYLSPTTGEVVSRRSDLWRFYDFFWRLHIMDYRDGENFNHPLIITVAGASLVVVLSGAVLLWFRLLPTEGRRRRREQPLATSSEG